MKTVIVIGQTPPAQTPEVGITISGEILLTLTLGLIVGSVQWLIKRELANSDRRVSSLEAAVSARAEAGDLLEAKGQIQRINTLMSSVATRTELVKAIDLSKVLEDRLDMAEKSLLEFRSEMIAGYVRREDWIRLTQQIENKLDSMNRKLDQRWELELQYLRGTKNG